VNWHEPLARETNIKNIDIHEKTDKQQCIRNAFVLSFFHSCFPPTSKRKQTTSRALGTPGSEKKVFVPPEPTWRSNVNITHVYQTYSTLLHPTPLKGGLDLLICSHFFACSLRNAAAMTEAK
jgi:hypothetical protein